MHRLRTLLPVLSVALAALLIAESFFVGEAAADVVQLKNGRTLEGKVRDTGGDQIEIVLPYGSLAFPRDLVASVERSATVEDVVAARLAELAVDDADGLYELALYCRDHSAYTLAGRLLDEVLIVDPDHAAARRDLGYVRDGDEWVSEQELRRRRGEVFFRGTWIEASERDRLLAVESAITAARLGSELEKARLEVELARLEAELERRAEPAPEGIPLYPGYGSPYPIYGGGAHGHRHDGSHGRETAQGAGHEAIERQLEHRRAQRGAQRGGERPHPTSAAANPGPRHHRGRLVKP